ncbi:hypothetical protein PIB30_073257 [Stylosanthes scabra]|uniref:Uncharacterized protein n=1 Tax=Stylosanthes scabra TaxID=79078 RepID=A0ABU6RPH3_9FABA|nr:hypothetical protein [Stylosanthes scabra]
MGECTITLEDVAYQLGLPIDGQPVSGCLWEFETLMPDGTGRPRCEWSDDMFGQLPEPQHRDACTVTFSPPHLRCSRTMPARSRSSGMPRLILQCCCRPHFLGIRLQPEFTSGVSLSWTASTILGDIAGVLQLLLSYTGIRAEHPAGTWFRWPAHYSSCRAEYFGVFLHLDRTDLTTLSFPWHPSGRGIFPLPTRKSRGWSGTGRNWGGHRGGYCPSVDMACGSQGPLDIDSATHLLLRHRVAPGGSSDPAIWRRAKRSPIVHLTLTSCMRKMAGG